MNTNSYLLVVFLFFVGCLSTKEGYYNKENLKEDQTLPTVGGPPERSLYLIGDAGDFDDEVTQTNFVLESVKQRLLEENSTVTSLVYLGDNLYPHGMPKKEDDTRERGEAVMQAQLDLARYCSGDSYVIPGNHDWKKGKEGGRKAMLRQEKFIKNYAEANNLPVHLYPKNACGDPKVVKINKDLVYVFIDSQWWLHRWKQDKKMNKGCEVASQGEFVDRIHEIILKHKNDEIVLFVHHPPKSDGTHGGKFALKHHLFPLHEVNNLWIPIPVLGSSVPIYRKTTGSVQDIPNPLYQSLIQSIDQIIKEVGAKVTFVSGHEHSLQFFKEGRLNYIVSGSGSRTNYTQAGGDALYAQEKRGFAILRFYKNGEMWVEYYTVDVEEKSRFAEQTFRMKVRSAKPDHIPETACYAPIEKVDTIVASNDDFGTTKLGKFFLGEQYRTMWTTPIRMPFIDLENKFGGLTPIRKGGGMSSNSLRMETESGKQYNLRSINKDYTKLLDEKYSDLAILDLLKDQNSASHPYGALLIPSLSEASGVYYTSPELVYLKKQSGLGVYNDLFPTGTYLLEQRPSGDWSDSIRFGSSSKIIGYTDLLSKLQSNSSYRIDQPWVLKSRMLDLFVHDWDRHDDQWRWALFPMENETLCRPIPRDRDQAFYKFEGLIPWYASTFLVKKLKTMKGDLRDVKNHSFNARYFDRYFLNELSWSDWSRTIEEFTTAMTDEVLTTSLDQLPSEVVDQNRPVVALLKERRENMMTIGKKLYDFLSEEVEVVGTDNMELFVIEYKEEGRIRVKVLSEEDKTFTRLRYDRLFEPEETKEIRLYGLRGKDRFETKGEVSNRIKVRIIGGEDKDIVEHRASGGRVKVYDTTKGMKLEGNKVVDKRSDALNVNLYDRRAFRYNTNFPFLVLGYTPDEGFWQGLSYRWTRFGWRKEPFKSSQKISFAVAPSEANSFLLNYEGEFPHIWGKLSFAPAVNVTYPENSNYFGLGNSTINPLIEKEFHWVKKRSIEITPSFRLNSKNGSAFLEFGPRFESVKILNTEGRVSDSPSLGFTDEEFKRRSYWGGRLAGNIDVVDRESFPGNGFRFHAESTYLNHTDSSDDLWHFEGNMSVYLTLFRYPKIILASSTGAEHSRGDLQFYQYPTLGNRTHLRGFRNDRFRGETSFYQNTDLRIKVLDWSNRYVPLELGLTGGYDVGRVWLEDEHSKRWHHSVTTGVWFDILQTIILQPYYSFTDEKDYFYFRMAFNF